MPVFRISRPDGQVVDADSIDAAGAITRSGKPGRSHIDEINSAPLSSGHTSRRWGVGIKHADGTLAIEPDPWPDR